MNEIRTLLTLELRSFYGINKFLHTKDLKEKSRSKKLGIVWLYLIAMGGFYMGSLAVGLCSIGLGGILLAYLAVVSGAFVLFFGIFSSGHRIFSGSGYDILCSMPVKVSSLVISRFLAIYIADLALTLVITVPGIAVYSVLCKPIFVFYPIALFGVLLLPVIPLVVSILFGTFVEAASSRMKNKNLAQTLFSVILVVGIMLASFGSESAFADFTEEQFFNLANTVANEIGKLYPPAMWFNNAAVSLNMLSLLLLVVLSLSAVLASVLLVSFNFKAIMHRLSNISVKKDYKLTQMQTNSLLKSLTVREMKRYFSSSIYVTNTIIGPIMGTVMCIALCVVGIEPIQGLFPGFIDVKVFLPFVFSAVLCMMNTTSVSISMEGNRFWVIKSLPIPMKALLDSKILFNLCLLLPFFVVSEIALFIAVKPDLLTLAWQLVIPALIMLFSVIFGMSVNLKLHSFDWQKEEVIVKQSASAVLGGFAGPILCILFGVVTAFTPTQYENGVKLVICILIFLACRVLYNKNNKTTYGEL